MKKNEWLKAIDNSAARSAWDKGVKLYAHEIVEELDIADDEEVVRGENFNKSDLLNGASSWSQYSYGGCSLIYDCDIAERLCNPSELKKTRNGERRPNGREEWLDVQARALSQAANRAMRCLKN